MNRIDTGLTHDLICIGGSAGALPALSDLLQQFNRDSAASIFVVLHRSEAPSRLPELLQKATDMVVTEARDGDRIERGHVYIAPADRHMLLAGDHLHLRRGPRENNFRPSIDPTLRSLAVTGSGRAIGVILSGYLDDGASGLRAVARCGGLTVVQDPEEASAPDLPRAAISAVGEPALIAPASAIGCRLTEMVDQPAPAPVEPPEDVLLELCVANLEKASMSTEEKLGRLTPINCPDCNGVLWELKDGPLYRYRCHTGHSWTERSLMRRKDEALERHLYETLRAQRERVAMLEVMADRYPEHEKRWRKSAESYREDAEVIEQILLDSHDEDPTAVDKRAAEPSSPSPA